MNQYVDSDDFDRSGGITKLPSVTRYRGSVLQDWVMGLQLREQGTLLTAIRGCDLTPKYPLESPERRLTAYLRWCVMVAVDPREIDSEPGCFMVSVPPRPFKPSVFGHYPLHWFSHVMHALEIIAYRHPNATIGAECYGLYMDMVKSLHLNAETLEQMNARLAEDRIAQGNIV